MTQSHGETLKSSSRTVKVYQITMKTTIEADIVLYFLNYRCHSTEMVHGNSRLIKYERTRWWRAISQFAIIEHFSGSGVLLRKLTGNLSCATLRSVTKEAAYDPY